MSHDLLPGCSRLGAALAHLTVVFGGMTARPDETNCQCHWGSAEELALLKIPRLPLPPDLLRRTWEAPDWEDHAAVLRRILPQFARSVVDGDVRGSGLPDAGYSLRRGQWQGWPGDQQAAVREFLHAWWASTLGDPDPVVPAHDVLVVLAEASGALRPWLAIWHEAAQINPAAGWHLATAAEQWRGYLVAGRLPWISWEPDEQQWPSDLTALLAAAGLTAKS